MAEDIPPDFDRAWSKSDVVLITLNSKGKELRANKAVLSVFSTYFDSLFSGRFPGKDTNSVAMGCNYNAMKEVLRNIHQIGFNYKSNGHIQYDAQMLKGLYFIGDFYNFPHIRKLCLDQMTDRPSVGMALTADDLDLGETVMNILMCLEGPEVRRFLKNKNVTNFFSKNEVLRLIEKVVGKPLPRGPVSSKRPKKPLYLEEITSEIQNPRIDLTTHWETVDVAICTKNSWGRILYSNRAVINTLSNKFKNLPLTPVVFDGEVSCFSGKRTATVDAEYATMKEILSIIHHCDTNYQGLPRALHPALLHSMYCVASEEQLDIPFIRDLCVAKLSVQKNIDSLEVLRNLEIPTYFPLSLDKWRDCVYREDGSLSYYKGDEVVDVTPSKDEPHFGNSMVLFLTDTLSPLIDNI